MKKLRFIFNVMLLCAVIFSCACSANAKTIDFAMATDIHYTVNNQTDSSRDISKSPKALRGFVERVNENNYDFVMFLGDSIDKSNTSNLTGFLEITQNINKPYYFVLGNHDAHKISGITKKDFLALISKYNKNQKKAEASYYFYPSPDVIAIVVDGATTGMPSSHGVFTQNTLRWLDTVLTKNADKKAVIFQHFPYIPPYENPSHDITNKTEYKAVINRHDNILAICSGHYHKEAVNIDERGVYHISTPALFNPPSFNYREIKVSYDKLPLQKAKNFKVETLLKPAI